MPKDVLIYTDGGSRGNPGPGASAYLVYDSARTLLEGRGIFLEETTNNIAEYTAIVRGLEAASGLGVETVQLYSDSELVVKQINGQYRVKNANLIPLHSRCMKLLSGFASWKVTHVRREKNKNADALANQAMDAGKDVWLKGEATRKHSTKGQESKENSRPALRLGILLSGGGRTMLNIQEEIEAGRLNANIVSVISSRSAVKGVERARNIGIEPEIIRRKDYDDIESFSAAIYKVLKAAKVDLVIQAGWLCLWKIPKSCVHKVMNIHPALLPAFGGQGMWGHHVHEAVLERGCKVSGCTVHFCTNEYDQGPIIVQRCCAVHEDDDADRLAERVFEQECIAYPEAIRLYEQNRIEIDGVRTRIKP